MINNNHISATPRTRGMTIIELMLTLSVVGILIAIAMPSFTTVIQNSRIRSQSSDLLANLAIARSESVKQGKRITMCPVANVAATPPVCVPSPTGWGAGYIVFVDMNGDGTFDNPTTNPDVLITVSEALAGGNSLTSATFAGTNALGAVINDELQFRSSGVTNLAAAGGTFKLCDSRAGNFGRLITIGATGRATSAQVVCP